MLARNTSCTWSAACPLQVGWSCGGQVGGHWSGEQRWNLASRHGWHHAPVPPNRSEILTNTMMIKMTRSHIYSVIRRGIALDRKSKCSWSIFAIHYFQGYLNWYGTKFGRNWYLSLTTSKWSLLAYFKGGWEVGRGAVVCLRVLGISWQLGSRLEGWTD